jgi:hypothetical protein
MLNYWTWLAFCEGPLVHNLARYTGGKTTATAAATGYTTTGTAAATAAGSLFKSIRTHEDNSLG